jgi:hypothetical protein
MKTTISIITAFILQCTIANAQQPTDQPLQPVVLKLDKAVKASDYEQLAGQFLQIASQQKTNWLSWYYAAFCHAKAGWLKQDDPDNIEPLANKADEEIKKARALLDSATQKKELAEVYCVLSILNRARVFMNPATYGREYGPKASQYVKMAEAADPGNPRALYLEGWEKFATPKAWGGDKVKAKEILLQSKQKLDESTSAGVQPHWGKKEVEELLSQLK